MPNARIAVTALLAGGLLLAGCSASPDSSSTSTPVESTATLPADTKAAFQQILDDARMKFDFPGAQAGVWTRDSEWVSVTGTSAQGGDRPPQRDDHTRIGSITKTFTVAVVLRLSDQGKVDLDDPIDTYVPGMPNGATATLRDLASMTSGIPPYSANEQFQKDYFGDPSTVFTPGQLVGYVKDDKPSFPAGTQVEYSNTNTVLLGMVVEKVTGEPFADVLRTELLDPLGMPQTSFPTDSPDLPDPYWEGITVQTDPEGEVKDATNFNPSWGFTAGAMISTLDDLHRWSVALGTGEGWVSDDLQKQRVDSMNSTVPPNSQERGYALGFGTQNGWIGHTGELPGYNTTIQYDPDTKTSIVVMVNSDIPAGDDNPAPFIADQLIGALPQS